MKPGTALRALLALSTLAAARTEAAIVRIEIHGTVEWNQFIDGPLVPSAVQPGDLAVMSFDVDSATFIDPPYVPPPGTCYTRGYPIIAGSFVLHIGTVDVPLLDPTATNPVPYWVIRDNDPAVDGVDFATDPCGNATNVPVSLVGASGGPFSVSFERFFDDGNRPNIIFPSLNILECLGTWGFESIEVYDFTINGGGGSPLGITYDWFSMTQLSPPAITQNPTAAGTCVGGSASFSMASAQAESYRWRFFGAPLTDGADVYGAVISGAATNSLLIQNVTTNHAGQYDCLVSNGPVTAAPYDLNGTDPAMLTIANQCVAGDMDCDEQSTAADVAGFVLALLEPGSFRTCNVANADLNQDGNIDADDVGPFVHLIMP